MTAQAMKTFQVHLESGTQFTVQAHHFLVNRHQVKFYKSEQDPNPEIFISTNEMIEEVIAILPRNDLDSVNEAYAALEPGGC